MSKELEYQQEIYLLQTKLAELSKEKQDIEKLLKLANEHADFVEKELFLKNKALEQERSELELLLEMTNVHSNAVEEHLQAKVDHALLESERRLRQFMEALPVGILVTDIYNKPYYLNRTGRNIIGVPDYELSAIQALDKVSCFLEGEDISYPLEENPLFNAIYKKSIAENIQILKQDGKRIPIEAIGQPIYDDTDKVVFGITAFRDISERKFAEIERQKFIQALADLNASLEEKVAERTEALTTANTNLLHEVEMRRQAEAALQQANEELSRLAILDGLTKIANRRCFDDYLNQQWLRLFREQQSLSLILSDIDFFKKYNDFYGHQGGDKCLIQVAQTVQAVVKRPADLLARYGGEEFAVILPNTSLKGAITVAEEMQQSLADLRLPHQASEVSDFVTLSIGIAEIIPHALVKVEDLIKAADQALYQAKREGRNRISYK